MAKADYQSITPGDPIHLAIERHKDSVRLWTAAEAVRAVCSDSEHQRRIDKAIAGARRALIDAGLDLIQCAPTTGEGIVAALQYIGERLRFDGVEMPEDIIIDSLVDDVPVSWITVFVATLADAASDLLARGCVHQIEAAPVWGFSHG